MEMSTVNITDLPLSDPRCDDDTCLAFAAAGDASQAQISWASQLLYSQYMAEYWCGWLAIFAILYAVRCVQDRMTKAKPHVTETRPGLSNRIVALGRSLSYRHLPGRIGNSLALPSLGVSAFVLISVLFTLLLCFAERPYYRERRGYGSPPIGVRSGMAAVALTPITFALAGKYNLVTLFTGISHEKLNVIHRWTAYIYLLLALIHTIPFIAQPLWEGGASFLHEQFYSAGSMEYTGIAPLVCIIFLCGFSAYWLRRQMYWIFAKSHIAGSIAFLGTLFWHVDMSGDSWDFLWATVAIYIVQLAARAFGKTTLFELSGKNDGWRKAGEVHLEVLDEGMTRMTMHVASRWKPGQHVFVRIPEFGMFNNHPFTIISTCRDALAEKGEASDALNKMTFLIRPYRGLTRRLLNYNGPAPYAMIDGPYGGISRPIHKLFDNIVLVGGGGGISALLPWLDDLSFRMAHSPDSIRLRRLSLFWCIRDYNAVLWVEEDFRRFVDRVSAGSLQIHIYVTGDLRESSIDGSTSTPEEIVNGGKEAEIPSLDRPFTDVGVPYTIHQGRPYLPQVLPPTMVGGKTMLLGCGPESMKTDLSNFAADAQKDVLAGKCTEIALHTETFDW